MTGDQFLQRPQVKKGIEFITLNKRFYRVIRKTISNHLNVSIILLPMFSVEDELAKDKFYKTNYHETKAVKRKSIQSKA